MSEIVLEQCSTARGRRIPLVYSAFKTNGVRGKRANGRGTGSVDVVRYHPREAAPVRAALSRTILYLTWSVRARVEFVVLHANTAKT
jgi:hypothetical protein